MGYFVTIVILDKALMRVKRRLLPYEFNAVRPLLKQTSDARIEAARRALVDGETLQVIGNHYGWTRQAVHDAVSVVWEAFNDLLEVQQALAAGINLPRGWGRVTLVAPKTLINQFKKEVAAAEKGLPETSRERGAVMELKSGRIK